MEDLHTNLLGTIAGIITSSSFIPQVIKIFKTKEVRDISLLMYLFLSAGITMWVGYGIMVKSFPIIFANAMGLLFSLTVVVTKLLYRDN